MDAGETYAILRLGVHHYYGENGYPQDYTKALELWHRAAELGYSESCCNIGYAYEHGQGVVVDKSKANHYYELAAIGGNTTARCNLGIICRDSGNMDRALKHFMIAARGGDTESLTFIKRMYFFGDASKGDYTKALQFYQAYLGEIKSIQRDKAAAADEENYY